MRVTKIEWTQRPNSVKSFHQLLTRFTLGYLIDLESTCLYDPLLWTLTERFFFKIDFFRENPYVFFFFLSSHFRNEFTSLIICTCVHIFIKSLCTRRYIILKIFLFDFHFTCLLFELPVTFNSVEIDYTRR